MRYYTTTGYYELSFGSGWTKAVKLLVGINIGVFIVKWFVSILYGWQGVLFLVGNFGFTPVSLLKFKIWQPITYMFFHSDFWHIFFNMLILYMFGPEVETILGYEKFIKFYLLCGLGGALCDCILPPYNIPIIGASAAVLGVLVAFGMFFPNRIVLLFFIIPVRVKTLVIFIALFNLAYISSEPFTGIAYLAHIGGMITAYIYICTQQGRSILPPSWYSISFFRYIRDTFWKIKYKIQNYKYKKEQREKERVDMLLDKISRYGMDSLTEEEREFLLKFSKRQSQKGRII